VETGREGGVVGAGQTVRSRRRAGCVEVDCAVQVLLPWAVDTSPNVVTAKDKISIFKIKHFLMLNIFHL
jgi:hypothetical protein